MTLTDALRLALDPATHASNITPLRQIVAHVVTDPADAPRGLVSRVLLFGLAPLGEGGHFAAEIPEIVMCCVNAGANLDDLRTVINEPAVAPEIPRSAEWVSAAERLAAWADGQIEPAPWDDPTAMSYEEIGDLVGL